jgi:ERCC4-type nuclease
VKITPTIIVDSREQRPWKFENLPTQTGTLDTGDYSISGLDHLVAVERKSLPDLLACCGRDRDRFKRELQRLRAYRFRLLVVETDADEIERGAWRSQLRPEHVLGSLAAWTAQYRLPIWLGGNHDAAGRFAERWLCQAARAVADQYASAAALLDAVEVGTHG